MKQDATSLDSLVDIVSLEPVRWWPWANGWWFALALLVVWGLFFGWSAGVRWVRNRYRREALKQLTILEMAGRNEQDRNRVLGQLATLLKRVALAAYARPRVASLTGLEWVRFLDSTALGVQFSSGPARCLASVTAADLAGVISADEFSVVIGESRKWIRGHGEEASFVNA